MASHPLSVLVVGGGVAAVEAAAALRELAGPRVAITIISDVEEFVYRPLTLREAFGRGPAPRRRLEAIADSLGARFLRARGRAIDRAVGRLLLDTREWMAFDEIILAPGATARVRIPSAITLGTPSGASELRGLAARLAAGTVGHLAFVGSAPGAWPLPLYECALLCASAQRVADPTASSVIVTAERRPLERFGPEPGDRLVRLLESEGIELVCDAEAEIVQPGLLAITDRRTRTLIDERRVDEVVALPELIGPHLRGIPSAAGGFIPIDRRCEVRGAPGIHAAGDATDYPVRHGSLAAQQADVAAAEIAAQAGAAVAPQLFTPVLEGILSPGAELGPLRARLVGGQPIGTVGGQVPPAAKISARYLGAVLARAESGALHHSGR